MKCRAGIIWVLCLWIIGCAPQDAKQVSTSNELRVVSLAPSLTEAVFQIGGHKFLVGRSQYCRHPEAVLDLPSVGRIDLPNIEALLSLKTNLISSRLAISFKARAMRQAKSSSSSPHGPRIKNGSPEPTVKFPSSKVFMNLWC